jgi:translocation protein SEC66
MALPIYVPIGYITVLVVSLSIFSKVYRRRTAEALVREHGQPWFPEGHPERDIYQTLVQASSSASGSEKQSNVVPDVVLKAALLNRAMADVRRIIRMRDDKQALSTLLQKGSIGDETMAKFNLAEKELEAEILDVVSEANTFREGWGQLIFPTASEMVAHLKHKDIYYGIQQQRAEEVKKLTEAGRPVPQPTVTLPPLLTPPGTSITLQAPGPQPQGPQPPPAGSVAVNGQAAASAIKSGSVQDADEEVS